MTQPPLPALLALGLHFQVGWSPVQWGFSSREPPPQMGDPGSPWGSDWDVTNPPVRSLLGSILHQVSSNGLVPFVQGFLYTPWAKRMVQPLQACSKFQVRVCASGGPARCVSPRREMNAWMNHTNSPPGPLVTCIGQNNNDNNHKCTNNGHDMGGQEWCAPRGGPTRVTIPRGLGEGCQSCQVSLAPRTPSVSLQPWAEINFRKHEWFNEAYRTSYNLLESQPTPYTRGQTWCKCIS